jgi:hypothetical protein
MTMRPPLKEDLNLLKTNKLIDLLRRAIANPGNLKEVAEQVALDWFPKFVVDSKGKVSIRVSTSEKR